MKISQKIPEGWTVFRPADPPPEYAPPSEEFQLRRSRPLRKVPARTPKVRKKAPVPNPDYLLRTYGLSLDAYQALLDAQDNACAICRRPATVRLQVDHDHATGAVRGLLCGNCNCGIGQLKDDPALLRRAIDYLDPSPRLLR